MKKIAIIRKNGLGDFIAGAVPVCNYLSEIYDNKVEFYFFMNGRNIGLAKYFFPESHSILIPDGNRYYTHISTALKYRNLHFDMGIIPVPDNPKLSSIFMHFLEPNDIYGNIDNSLFAKKIINHPCEIYKNVPYEKHHVSLRSLSLIVPELTETPKRLYPKFQQNMINVFPLEHEKSKNYIMVELSNNRSASQLSIEKTARILNQLHKAFDFTTLITAKPNDSSKASKLQTLLNGQSEFHTTNSLDEFLAYVNRSTYVLAGDGGLGHIAGALGKKLVCLYGITPIDRWGVLGENVIHLSDPHNVNNIPVNLIIDSLLSL